MCISVLYTSRAKEHVFFSFTHNKLYTSTDCVAPLVLFQQTNHILLLSHCTNHWITNTAGCFAHPQPHAISAHNSLSRLPPRIPFFHKFISKLRSWFATYSHKNTLYFYFYTAGQLHILSYRHCLIVIPKFPKIHVFFISAVAKSCRQNRLIQKNLLHHFFTVLYNLYFQLSTVHFSRNLHKYHQILL